MKFIKTQLNEIMKKFNTHKQNLRRNRITKEIQTEIKLSIKKLGCPTKSSEISLINRLQDTKERISGVKDKVRKIDNSN